MAKTDFEKEKQAFVAGKANSLRLGGYGGTVHVRALNGVVRMEVSKPRRKQRNLGPDSKRLRAEAVETAEAFLHRLQGTAPSRPKPARAAEDTVGAPLLVYHIWQHRLQSVLPGTPEEALLEWKRKDLAAHYRSLPTNVRAQAKAEDTARGIMDSARRLNNTRALPFEAEYDALEPENLNRHVRGLLAAGRSAHTAKSDVGRFGTAIREYARARPKRWGRDRFDVTQGVGKITTAHIQPDEVGEENAQRLISRLRAMGFWRTEAAARVALGSARRVGAISGGRSGLHEENPPLTALDFREEEDGGGLQVCWRAEVQKGRSFGRGDVEQPATVGLEETYRWLVSDHPNPLGPEHPLIWDEKDPTRPAPYYGLRYEFTLAWKAEFGEERPKGLLWHSFCYTTITTLVDEVGASGAAEFTGRSVETVLKIYKRRRPAKQKEIASALDRVRGLRREPRGP
jgi:hypothetical protein